MRKYIFLDNWALSKFTGAEARHRLIAFLKNNDYTGLVTSLVLVELYNPGWEMAADNDRVVEAINFLSEIPCVIVDPLKVFRVEIELYPIPVETLPIELDLREIPNNQRIQILLQFMRRDVSFLKQGKDIEEWSKSYKKLKDDWLDQGRNIIEHSCNQGLIKRNKNGKFIDLARSKELFLLSLDLRHTNSTAEKDILFNKVIVEKNRGNLLDLLAIRVTSLCIWYSYIAVDPSNLPSYKPSDIGDYYHMGLIPYCSAFMIDKHMQRLLKRFQEQRLLGDCMILSEIELRKHLRIN